MTTKILKSSSAQRVIKFGLLILFTFIRMYLLSKHMPDSNKYIYVYTKSRIKTNKLKNLPIMSKFVEMCNGISGIANFQ